MSAAGSVLARVQGPPGRVDVRQPDAGAVTLAELTRRALAEAGAQPPAMALCCALAGAGRPPERSALELALRAHNVARTIVIVGDAEAALQDAFGSGPGILLVAGTGSMGWGRGQDGVLARCGGWGHLLGDEGSGYAIGAAALRASVQAHDGRRGATPVLSVVLQSTGVQAVDDLIGWAASASKADVAALAPAIIELADTDPTAAEIVELAARDLAEHVAALYHNLSPWTAPAAVALTGGLLDPGRPLRRFAESAIRDWELALQILPTPVDPARGAASLAQLANQPGK